jgi:hypothetical protein
VSAIGSFNPKPVKTRSHNQSYASDPQAEALRQKIIKLMTDASNNSARSLQKAIGPSEIGHACPRNVAYKVAGVTENPSYLDPMPSILGVAFHAWMEQQLPADEWIPEQRVHVTDTLSGHSDAYHIPTRTVVDWKLLGRTQHQEWLGGYTKEQYELQADCYGLGFVNAGYPVDRVAVAVFCRARPLQDLFLWSRPWNPDNARRALERLEIVRNYVAASGASDTNRAAILKVPAVAGDSCYFCSYKGTSLQGLCDRAK